MVANFLADDGEHGRRAREALRGSELVAPSLVDLEVIAALRGHERGGKLASPRAAQAIADLSDMPMLRFPTEPLIPRIWEMRHNCSSYDAAYVALAEAFDLPLVTADAPLAQFAESHCEVTLLGSVG